MVVFSGFQTSTITRSWSPISRTDSNYSSLSHFSISFFSLFVVQWSSFTHYYGLLDSDLQLIVDSETSMIRYSHHLTVPYSNLLRGAQPAILGHLRTSALTIWLPMYFSVIGTPCDVTSPEVKRNYSRNPTRNKDFLLAKLSATRRSLKPICPRPRRG